MNFEIMLYLFQELKEITVNKTECLYNDLIMADISDTGVRTLVGDKLKQKLSPNLLGPLQRVKASSNSK